MTTFNITPISLDQATAIQSKIDLKTKPLGALGKLESIAFQLCCIQDTLAPTLSLPTIIVFAADHGIARDGQVNPFPQEVTFQMVMNFLQGGAAINVFARQHGIALKVVDAGVNYDFGQVDGLIDGKIALGTHNYLKQHAMSRSQCEAAIDKGAQITEATLQTGCNCIGFGEMGIGNTSASALLMSAICQLPIDQCVGKGTGVVGAQYQQKLDTLAKVQERHRDVDSDDPIALLATFGGFEIAQICGGMLKAAEKKAAILVDGFITTAALLVAQRINPLVLDYVICTHQSEESGHKAMLEHMGKVALIDIGMRLGEGSGAAVAYPIVESACAFINQMASFDAAAVSQPDE